MIILIFFLSPNLYTFWYVNDTFFNLSRFLFFQINIIRNVENKYILYLFINTKRNIC